MLHDSNTVLHLMTNRTRHQVKFMLLFFWAAHDVSFSSVLKAIRQRRFQRFDWFDQYNTWRSCLQKSNFSPNLISENKAMLSFKFQQLQFSQTFRRISIFKEIINFVKSTKRFTLEKYGI